jgi:hypothetical protein
MQASLGIVKSGWPRAAHCFIQTIKLHILWRFSLYAGSYSSSPPSEKLMKSIRHARIKRQANPETHNIKIVYWTLAFLSREYAWYLISIMFIQLGCCFFASFLVNTRNEGVGMGMQKPIFIYFLKTISSSGTKSPTKIFIFLVNFK